MRHAGGVGVGLYALILLALVAVILALSLLIGDRSAVGRLVWLALGILLGVLWGIRERLPILDSPSRSTALAAWAGLAATGAVVLAIAPTSPAAFLPGSILADSMANPTTGGLRTAPPTAVRRTGTVAPVTTKPASKPSPSPSPSSRPSASPASRPAASASAPRTSPTAVGTAGLASTPAPPTDADPSATPVDATPSATSVDAAPTSVPASSAPASLPPDFDPDRYLGQGNAFECSHFTSQAQAQAVLRRDPTDPNVIDRNRDGVACEDLAPPRDTRRVPRPAQ